jgi:cysteine desulfurase
MSREERSYLDWNATAPMRPQAREAVLTALDCAGNPSSVHREGRKARAIVEKARADVAALFGASPREVVFTSGGTEANMLALTPSLLPDGRRCSLLISAIEHPSVHCGGRFPPQDVEEVAVLPSGKVDEAAFAARVAQLTREGTSVVASVMLANNESGVIQPVRAVAGIVHEAGGLIHVDAVQAAGRIPVDMDRLGADLLTVSAHKLGGPKGTGALLVRKVGLRQANALIRGGGQERGFRAGTENVPGIAGFGAAAAAARVDLSRERAWMVALQERLEAGLKEVCPSVIIFGASAERLPNTTLFAEPGIKAETGVIALDLEGVAVSSGAACSSGKVQSSHVLRAMGVSPAVARGAIRVSWGYSTARSEIDRFLNAWKKLREALNKGTNGIAA